MSIQIRYLCESYHARILIAQIYLPKWKHICGYSNNTSYWFKICGAGRTLMASTLASSVYIPLNWMFDRKMARLLHSYVKLCRISNTTVVRNVKDVARDFLDPVYCHKMTYLWLLCYQPIAWWDMTERTRSTKHDKIYVKIFVIIINTK